MTVRTDLDLVVVGGGQAGLATSRAARQAGMRHVVLDAGHATGDSWRARYNSLTLFTPRRFSALPGLDLPGDPDGYPSKDEVAAYLDRYARHIDAPVRHRVKVLSVRWSTDGTGFVVTTDAGSWAAPRVVIATGAFHRRRIPGWADRLGGRVTVHSHNYRSPEQLLGMVGKPCSTPRVLVVGGGNSGAQIGEELHDAGWSVAWSVRTPPRYMPERVLGRSVFWWLSCTGVLRASGSTVRAALLRRRPDPIWGGRMKRMVRQGAVRPVPEAVDVDGHGRVVHADGTLTEGDAVIFCTGFTPDFGIVDVSGAIGEDGTPDHEEGLSRVSSGLGFVGLEWQRSRASALIGGVGSDAAHVIDRLSRHTANG